VPAVHAAVAVAGGCAFAATSALGGALVEGVHGVRASLPALFIAAAAVRLSAVAAALVLPCPRTDRPALAAPAAPLASREAA
jgi:hypothetical protein